MKDLTGLDELPLTFLRCGVASRLDLVFGVRIQSVFLNFAFRRG
jgi:hypothetical protein